MNKRETVGKVSQLLSQKQPDTQDPIELQQEMQKDYISNLFFAVQHATKRIDCSSLHKECDIKEPRQGDFYILVITKKERLLENVIRNYFFTRDACPTPDYDQAVYKYHADTQDIEFIWIIPSKDTCLLFVENALQIIPEEKPLLQFILDFKDGTLMKKAKILNGEQHDSPLLSGQ